MAAETNKNGVAHTDAYSRVAGFRFDLNVNDRLLHSARSTNHLHVVKNFLFHLNPPHLLTSIEVYNFDTEEKR